MKTPPLLLGAALLFWGWQTGFFIAGLIMAVVLEAARFIKPRLELSDDDFSRIWTFCTLVFLAAAIYAFTDNGGPARFSQLFESPNFATQGRAGIASARTAAAMLRWLPMVLFLFVAAQAYSSRQEIPATTMSLILRRRWKKAEKLGRPMPPARGVNVAYPYFATAIFAASMHSSEDNSFFWGLCVLLPWALWPHRSSRFRIAVWAGTLGVAFGLGYFAQHGINQLQNYVQNLNTQWIVRLMRRGVDPTQSRTAIGELGRAKLSGRIVIRLEPENGREPPTYLREASYRLFASPQWSAGSSKDDFANVTPVVANGTTYALLPKPVNNRISIASYLNDISRDGYPSGLLPLPSGVGKLDRLQAFTLERNSAGAVLASGPRLVIFDALYGPGATIDSSPNRGEDRRVPDSETNALEQIISEMRLDGTNTEQKLREIRGYFLNNFTYSTWQNVPRASGQTPLTQFLTSTRSGHCEYFATATVLLLRELGIPARYAVGYFVHEKSGHGYVVRERDGHAWCLVWNREAGIWQDFDTTPPSWMEEEAQHASAFQWFSDSWSWITFQFSKFRWGQSHWRQYVLITMIPILVVLFVQIFFRRKKSHRVRKKPAIESVVWPGLDSEFYRVEKILAARGIQRKPSEPLADWLLRALTAPGLGKMRENLQTLLHLHYQYRFDPAGLSELSREELRRGARECLEKLRAAGEMENATAAQW